MQITPFVSLCKYGFWSHDERTHSIPPLAVAVVEALSTRRGSQTELTIRRSLNDGFGYERLTFRFQDKRDHDTGNLGKQMYSTNHIFIPVLCTTLVKEILNKKKKSKRTLGAVLLSQFTTLLFYPRLSQLNNTSSCYYSYQRF